VCSDVCTVSCALPTCGIVPASADSECNALPNTRFCGDTNDYSVCGPCCA
jgi:hypothetical protein